MCVCVKPLAEQDKAKWGVRKIWCVQGCFSPQGYVLHTSPGILNSQYAGDVTLRFYQNKN